jgi:predicted ATP-dependent endonuclease of OLD family
MNLIKVIIRNYRSIDELSINIKKNTDDTFTYGLIGVNEAGKSSILKAIALQDGLFSVTTKDFKNKSLNIEVEYQYELNEDDSEFLMKAVLSISDVKYKAPWEALSFKSIYTTSDLNGTEEIEIYSAETSLKISEEELPENVHQCIFWTADDQYLISNPINLKTFASNPESISVPLRNCFLLAGIKNIKEAIDEIEGDSTEKEDLEEKLGMAVTTHIKAVWPNHPITITFHISDGLINFHVKDDSKSKAKVATQRSDGFKQFISFLLTISAENKNSELERTILLLDEPETHLHPQAQEYLLTELKKITSNDRENIVIFATHSVFMIDKLDINKNFRVFKKNDTTNLSELREKISSYSGVIYEVFDIPSSDYHNELYGALHERFIDGNGDEKESSHVKVFDSTFLRDEKGLPSDFVYKGNKKQCTLPTYIRNCIHHPESGNKYSEQQLKESIDLMRGFF